MKTTRNIIWMLLLLALNILPSCKKQESNPENEIPGELLTTVKLILTDTATGVSKTFVWSQPKGPGTAISVDTLQMKAGVFYSGRTEVWNESVTPALNISSEIEELSNEHLFVYSSNSSMLQIQITDKDKHIPPMDLGLQYTLQYLGGSPFMGNLEVKLLHFRDANKTDINSGNTDIAVTFPLRVQ